MLAADPAFVLRIVLDVGLVGLAISSLESLVSWRSFRADAVYSWPLFCLRRAGAPQGMLGATLNRLFSVSGIAILLTLRLLGIVLVAVLPLYSPGFRISLSAVVVTCLLMSWRQAYGDDGSDQMTLIILIAAWIATAFFRDSRLVEAALWFIALQAVLSYSAAGISKLTSRVWREGQAVFRIFSTNTYGMRWVTDLLRDRRSLNLLLCWSVMVIESSFVLALLFPLPVAWIFLFWGACFHLACALIMGLNNFLWAFLAAYPAILYAAAACDRFFYR